MKIVVIPASVTSIGDGAFEECSNLKTVVIPASVTSISNRVFKGCRSMTTINIPDSVTSIGDGAFEQCSNLKTVIIPDSVTNIGDSAFARCRGLKTVVIPDSVINISNSAFEGCYSLEAVYIPASVTSIGDSAFGYCSGLKAVVIPGSVSEIGTGAFAGVHFDYDHLFDKKAKKHGCRAAFNKNAIVPEGMTRLPEHIFEGTGVTSVILPETLEEIGKSAFAFCTDLKKINFPKKLKKIDSYAFKDCKMETVSLPATVIDVAPDAFPKDVKVTVGGVALEIAMKVIENQQADSKELKAIEDLEILLTDRLSEKEAEIGRVSATIEELEEQLKQVVGNREGIVKQYNGVLAEIDRKTDAQKTAEEELNKEESVCKSEEKQLREQLKSTVFFKFAIISKLKRQIAECGEKVSFYEQEKKELTDRLNQEMIDLKAALEKRLKVKDEHFRLCDRLAKAIEEMKKERDALCAEKGDILSEIKRQKRRLSIAKSKHAEQSRLREIELEDLKETIRNREMEEKKRAEEKAREEEQNRKFESMKEERSLLLKEFAHDCNCIINNRIITPVSAVSGFEEKLLNSAYEKMIESLNNYNAWMAIKSLYMGKTSKLARLKKINRALKLEADDGLPPLLHRGAVSTDFLETTYYPERVGDLCVLFSCNKEWGELKKAIVSLEIGFESNDPHMKFFPEENLATIKCSDKTTFVFLPYTIVFYGDHTEMHQCFYHNAKISYQCVESEYEDENCADEPAHRGEVIGNHYKYEKADGTPNRRYSKNPVIWQLRNTFVTIECGKEKHSMEVAAKDIAEEFVEVFESFKRSLSNAEFKSAYEAVIEFAEVPKIESIMKESRTIVEEQAERAREERARLELLKETEKRAAEKEAAQKRLTLIEKQKLRNAEKRYDQIPLSEEKVFVENETDEGSQDFAMPLNCSVNAVAGSFALVVKNADLAVRKTSSNLRLTSLSRVVYNNIFTLEFDYSGERDDREYVLVMCDKFGNEVSNEAILKINEDGVASVVMSLNKSTFNSKAKYYLIVINKTEQTVEITEEFSINIVFADDFGI